MHKKCEIESLKLIVLLDKHLSFLDYRYFSFFFQRVVAVDPLGFGLKEQFYILRTSLIRYCSLPRNGLARKTTAFFFYTFFHFFFFLQFLYGLSKQLPTGSCWIFLTFG